MSKFSTLTQLLRFMLPYRRYWIGAMIALLFTASITLAIGQGVRLVIDNGFVAGSVSQLNQSILLLVAMAVLMACGTFIRFYLVSWLGERVTADIRQAVFDNVIRLHPSFFETNRSGEIMSRLTTDTTLLQSIIGSSFSMALRSVVTTSGALLMLFVTNIKLSLIIVAGVPLILLPILIFGRKVRKLARQSQDSIADVGSYAGEAIQQIKTVQSYTQEAHESRAFSVEVDSAFRVAQNRIRQRALLMAMVILLVFGALSGMLWVGGYDVINGTMSAGELGAFVFYALIVAMGVGTMSEVYGELQRAVGATERLMELLDAESDIKPPEGSTLVTKASHSDAQVTTQEVIPTAATLPAELSLSHVYFNYPSRPDQPALEDFSLTFKEGAITALVGPSGAGKSTVFELLLRFYDPQQGQVRFASQDLRRFNPWELRQQIALVSQQPALFTANVIDNIRYGRADATEEEVIAAAKAAYAHEFIERLPQGYHSDLGEQGVRLSGGQKQRIAIARAILNDRRILLLDEATSALDTESEHNVQLALDTLMQGRTTVIIAHRLSTILHADQIVVMEQGRVVGTGTHESLLQSSDLYARLAQLQFKHDAQTQIEPV
ncbi:ABC transporter transmembrane domain-containing protein [Amphritea sp. 2_MG-2023]|uniref:ABC transporter transmembrane domain-containing protein n=1 Tax=Amphritea TaxID=515417 RepID=UPI001C07B26A|nr:MULTISPECIES: ABC transporter transmembrane domain-containing protein [Amphritea]MBU2964407.1 ATP-binding cassette domain-containing protein [Amphritea atlantica]MDO6417735.1 ABC transporter transmembrane domain-containing protein [Amphritea sp. 2_MG-2023]